MADAAGGDTSRHAFQVAYDGGPAAGHSMDVEALAPALLGFGRLIRESNTVLNQNKAAVKVVITSDFEHKCFSINFEVLQTVLQKIQSFLQDDNVKTATEILEKIGIIASAGSTTIGSLFGFFKWKRGRQIKNIQKIRDSSPSGSILLQIQIEGDGNTIQVPSDILKLAENKKILEAVKETLEPIESREAERIEFRKDDKTVSVYDGQAAQAIVRSCDAGPDPVVIDQEGQNPIVTATLYTHGPVFDPKARNWRFKYKRKPIYADVSETSIAKDAVRRGGSFMNDRYRVRMEVMPAASEDGTPHYKILEVLDFSPAEQQTSLPLRKPRRNTKTAKPKKRP
jgi:hypothetical protein